VRSAPAFTCVAWLFAVAVRVSPAIQVPMIGAVADMPSAWSGWCGEGD